MRAVALAIGLMSLLAAPWTAMAGVAGATTYTYDAQGRLTCTATPDGYFMSYILDGADNRTRVVRNRSACTSADQSQPPVPNNSSATVAANSTNNWITLSIKGGTATSVAVSRQANHGAATASGATISYTPSGGYAGADDFQYTAHNSAGTSSAATVSITITSTSPPAAPIANNVSASVLYNSTNNSIPLNITGGTPATVYVVGQSVYGYATAWGTSILYTPVVAQPSNGASTSDSFVYVASNTSGASAPATTSITINPPGPTAYPVSATVGYNSFNTYLNLSISGTYNSVAVSSPASHGAAGSNGTGIYYRPNAGYSGSDSFQYTASLGSMTSAPATVSITVAGPSGPSANADTMNLQGQRFGATGYAVGCIDPTVNDTSPQGYPLTVTGVSASQWQQNFMGQTSYSSSPNQVCYYSPHLANFQDNFTYSISDGHGGIAVGAVTVNVVYPQ